MSKPARFTQADLTRAVRGVEKAGLCVAIAEIHPDGSIRILTGAAEAANDRNPLDRVFSR